MVKLRDGGRHVGSAPTCYPQGIAGIQAEVKEREKEIQKSDEALFMMLIFQFGIPSLIFFADNLSIWVRILLAVITFCMIFFCWVGPVCMASIKNIEAEKRKIQSLEKNGYY